MSTSNVWMKCRQVLSTDIKQPRTNGRSPWYNHSPKSKRRKPTFLIGVAGGTASGKTSVCRAIVNNLQLPWVQILSLDCFYRPLTSTERADANQGNYNFDHPNAFDWELLLCVLRELKQGKAVKCPQYDFTTHSRKEEYTLMYGADVVLVEGILMLHHPEVVKQFDVKVFVNTDDDIRLIRRIKRDIAERGRTLEGVIAQYTRTVKPSYQLFCEPTQQKADLVIPRGRDNTVAIELLCDHIKNKLIEGGNINPVFYEQGSSVDTANNKLSVIHSMTQDLPCTVSILGEDDKLIQLAVHALQNDEQLDGQELLDTLGLLCKQLLALCLDQFIPRKFVTPSPETTPPSPTSSENVYPEPDDSLMNGRDQEKVIAFVEDEDEDDEVAVCKVCVVTVFSGGIVFGETIVKQIMGNESLRATFGSIHVFHEAQKPARPRFYDRKLPRDIQHQKVVMLDAFIGTGNRARMALQVLVDHHVPEENICYISLLSSQEGIVNLAKVFPAVQFITASIEDSADHAHWETVPVTSKLVIKYCKAAGINIVDE